MGRKKAQHFFLSRLWVSSAVWSSTEINYWNFVVAMFAYVSCNESNNLVLNVQSHLQCSSSVCRCGMSNGARKCCTLRHPESSAPDIIGVSVEAVMTVLWKPAPEKTPPWTEKKKKKTSRGNVVRNATSQNKSVAKKNLSRNKSKTRKIKTEKSTQWRLQPNLDV